MLKATFGARRASKLLQSMAIAALLGQGFARLQVTVMVIYRVEKGIHAVVHRDNFTAAASFWLNEVLTNKSEVRKAPSIGPARAGRDATSGRFLKRTMSWIEDDFHWESDERRARVAAEAHGNFAASRQISLAS